MRIAQNVSILSIAFHRRSAHYQILLYVFSLIIQSLENQNDVTLKNLCKKQAQEGVYVADDS